MPTNYFQVTATSLGFELFQGRKLFHNISFTLTQARYGLVGPNGIGKSTLASMLAGDLEPTSGNLHISHGVAYLRQEGPRPRGTIAEYLENLWESSVEPEVWGVLLEGLSFESSLEQLSGGEWTRVRIVKALAQGAGLLILDEPTNNLDRPARTQILQFVRNYKGALLVISHDRELLEEMDSILELSNQGLTVYGGNFSSYWQAREAEREKQVETLDRLRREKKKLEKEQQEKLQAQEKRLRRGERISARGGMPKILLGALKRKAEETHGRIHVHEEQRVEKARTEFSDLHQNMKKESVLSLKTPMGEVPEGKLIFELADFNFSYPATERLLWKENINLVMKGPRRWALLGRNGSGKTTLLQLLISQGAKPQGQVLGRVQLADIAVAVLDQSYSLLDQHQSVLENVQRTSRMSSTELRNELAQFQFFGEQVHQTVSSLSGGEKLKASLAKLLLATPAPQFLILDEPTNNLDIESLETLEQAMRAFSGALLVVSHDECFLENIGIEEVYVLQPDR